MANMTWALVSQVVMLEETEENRGKTELKEKQVYGETILLLLLLCKVNYVYRWLLKHYLIHNRTSTCSQTITTK